ncbi:TPA: hypothetical protein ACH3X2_004698 [Trebouxia sp. C0005]
MSSSGQDLASAPADASAPSSTVATLAAQLANTVSVSDTPSGSADAAGISASAGADTLLLYTGTLPEIGVYKEELVPAASALPDGVSDTLTVFASWAAKVATVEEGATLKAQRYEEEEAALLCEKIRLAKLNKKY